MANNALRAGPLQNLPLRTPFFDGSGDTTGPDLVKKLGNVSRTWALFLGQGSNLVSQGAHADRVGLNAGAVPASGIFVETDRNAVYQARLQNKTDPAWVLVLATMSGPLAGLPADLGPNDAGFIYNSTDAASYRWDGTAWATIGGSGSAGAVVVTY